VDKEGVFRTVALAGTQSVFDAVGQPIPPKQAPWTQKEIEEQALVGRYIISCFKKIRVREYVEEGPKTVVAGSLMHLCSDYTVDTKAINFPELGTVMLELLHPTSAVCGMPKMAALEFIQNHETYDREFYSGFLGPVNVENETNLFVNLRCMKIQNGTATLYAGGGITEDSVPEKEWQETELKCQTMLAVLA
jgi:isochorismate synthase